MKMNITIIVSYKEIYQLSYKNVKKDGSAFNFKFPSLRIKITYSKYECAIKLNA
jgi:hypothetical protein